MLQTFLPSSELLKQYIDMFYVFTGDQPRELHYIAFPHVNTAISFFSGVTISRADHAVAIAPVRKKSPLYSVEILGKYTEPVFVQYQGGFEEVAIVFKPFGVNQFIRGDLIKSAPAFSQALPAENWLLFAAELFRDSKPETRIQRLEAFLLDNMVELDNEMIRQSLLMLSATDADYSIAEIAALHAMNVKTFQRKFLNQMSCTPSEYKRIARFRNALQTRLQSRDIKTLTSLSYESNYYDQSYFIREFKKLTRLNPKKFFEAITVLDKKKIVWEIK